MYAAERQQSIAAAVADHGRLSVAEIASTYDVTTETVRRDLTLLERAGFVRRVHGGVVPARSLSMIEAAVADRDSANAEQKDLIAEAALDLLPDPHGTLLLDAGTTTVRLAARLPMDHPLTLITHSVPVAARAVGLPHVDLHLLPGRVRSTTQAAVGAETVAALSALRADVVMVGSNGVTEGLGLSTPDHDEAATKQAMVRSGRTVVALVDSTKIGIESTHRFAELADVDVLVTDAGIDPADRRALEKRGLEVRTT
ncbi:D-beta-D-heptose 1-phosphate adenosyltransferase [Marmoricola endophyticus]|uniref:Lactose phosphotransferase system repressor n=1 Tax=Marmoricola endophyticus TaxID=2040280 RepID=A0A917BDM6_9ACTN|nr:DeoR/GlpR family DNA-binding transcription regulator [Marmoricola endophyticus]GGF38428.1 D-beta-D-heptose 1-phosphate adenosyltransferase [Marmoricola endophyticus]